MILKLTFSSLFVRSVFSSVTFNKPITVIYNLIIWYLIQNILLYELIFFFHVLVDSCKYLTNPRVKTSDNILLCWLFWSTIKSLASKPNLFKILSYWSFFFFVAILSRTQKDLCHHTQTKQAEKCAHISKCKQTIKIKYS